MSDTIRWIKVAESVTDIPFGPNNIAEVTAEGKRLCIARYQDALFAFAQKCPHASGALSGGFLDAMGNVVCPLHRYKFCVKNGRNVSGEGYYLKHWPVKTGADGVWVGLDARSFMGLF